MNLVSHLISKPTKQNGGVFVARAVEGEIGGGIQACRSWPHIQNHWHGVEMETKIGRLLILGIQADFQWSMKIWHQCGAGDVQVVNLSNTKQCVIGNADGISTFTQ